MLLVVEVVAVAVACLAPLLKWVLEVEVVAEVACLVALR